MRINSINTYYPSFGYSSKTVRDSFDDVQYRTTTYFYRPDMNWKELSSFLAKKYKYTDKVNVLNYACSTGEETFTLISQLLKDHGVNANKFFPIVAKDIDEENIETAKSGVLQAGFGEMIDMGRRWSDKETRFFSWNFGDKKKGNVTINDIVRNNAIFSQADIHKDFEAKPMRNTVLICRNVWPYFYKFEQENLIKKIAESFVDDTSLLIVGEYDSKDAPNWDFTAGGSVNYLLKKYDFVPVGPKYVYQKSTDNVNAKQVDKFKPCAV